MGIGACSRRLPETRSSESARSVDSLNARPVLPDSPAADIDNPRFSALAEAARLEIAAGHLAGAVMLVGHKGDIVYRKAFGHKRIKPQPEAMTADTIFDLASLTKVVATATATMQLVERGQLQLDKPAAAYWPEFGQNGKQLITLRQLLTHTSGLRAD
ncbi:MAG: serine hydrolase, partial [Methylomonas sp.]|nr:serine hydrolase [Methylomonas sp.]